MVPEKPAEVGRTLVIVIVAVLASIARIAVAQQSGKGVVEARMMYTWPKYRSVSERTRRVGVTTLVLRRRDHSQIGSLPTCPLAYDMPRKKIPYTAINIRGDSKPHAHTMSNEVDTLKRRIEDLRKGSARTKEDVDNHDHTMQQQWSSHSSRGDKTRRLVIIASALVALGMVVCTVSARLKRYNRLHDDPLFQPLK